MAGKVSLVVSGYEIPTIVKQDRDFTTNIVLRELIEKAYSYGVPCSVIERLLGYKTGAVSYGCDLGKIKLIEPALGVRRKGEGIKLLKGWVK